MGRATAREGPGPPGSDCALTFLSLCPHHLHSGPPASWLQLALAVPLQDLQHIELGLAGQSLRLEWAAGVGACVLLPREAKRCRAFREELTGEKGQGAEGGWGRGLWTTAPQWRPQ